MECHGGKCTVEVAGTMAGDVGAMCVGGLVDTINYCCVEAKWFWLSSLVPCDIDQNVSHRTGKNVFMNQGVVKPRALLGCNMAFLSSISFDLSRWIGEMCKFMRT